MRLGDVRDGTSQTLMGGEIVVVRDLDDRADTRGRYLDALTGGTLFTTLQPPNKAIAAGRHPKGRTDRDRKSRRVATTCERRER